jgi:hypothetical protein
LESRGFSPPTIKQALSAIRRFGFEVAGAGMLDPNIAAAVGRVKTVGNPASLAKPLSATAA